MKISKDIFYSNINNSILFVYFLLIEKNSKIIKNVIFFENIYQFSLKLLLKKINNISKKYNYNIFW